MKKYWVAFKIQLQSQFIYRGDQLVYTFSYFIVPSVSLAIWLVLSSYNTQLAYNRVNLIYYFILVTWVNIVVSSWAAYFLGQQIETGDVGGYFIRPWSAAENYFINNISQKTLRVTFITPFFILLLFFVSKTYAFHFTLVNILLFLPSLLMAYILNFFI